MKTFKSEKGRQLIYASYDKLLKQWGGGFEQLDVDTKYGTTHVIRGGDESKPDLLLFHGVGDNSALMWIYNAAELVKHFRITAIDAVGGAGKSVPGAGYGKDFDQKKWLREVMDDLKIEKAHAAGVSYGCYLAQLVKIRLPERIGRIVCMSGGVSVETEGSNMFKMMKLFLPEALFPTEGNVLKLLKKLTGPDNDNLLENSELMNHWKLLLKNFNNMSMGRHKLEKFTKQEIEGIKDDALFLIGDHDRLTYTKNCTDAADKLGVRYEIIRNAGHALNHEKPDIVNKRMIEFL